MRRIVIKVGSAVLTEQNRVAKERMAALVDLIAKIKEKGTEVILVSSGAVAAGYTMCKLDKKIVSNKQALASIGQPKLVAMYQKKFEKHNTIVAQILLTADDFDSRKRTYHAKCAVEKLLEQGVVPIINENDVTATEELVFGDNDQLSAHVAYYFDAELLVILSDIDSYYDKDPHKYKDAKPLKVVHEIPKEDLQAECTPNGSFATGGIVTKLKAADFLIKRNKEMFLASGFNLSDAYSYLIYGIHNGGTRFLNRQ
ncbi:glutamate 5-kinase [Hydrogenimonas thermophila]|uniref:glutamate 5-kinase n=1 Tax=Hydrogenimonas thermophila TaxID=223786 RepID=UPI002936F029|nr:glutamate 5-kinase [Hydrogenimonas thermophila]WOE70824.1 glutamate 5-kinase [Hydrogenimonas thermophila]WOE73342.1 glutamate 5-kinase [Hydrogenimonas thermophila]